MRRKLDLGASLVGAPELLLLDEPTTGLDPRSRNDLWDAIRDLVSAGTDVLLTTQYLDEADQLAARIAVIGHGKVIAAGTFDELKSMAGIDVVEVSRVQSGRPRPGHRRPRPARVRGAAGRPSHPLDRGPGGEGPGPLARLGIVAGRVIADTILAGIGLTVTTLVGFAMGFSAPLGGLMLAIALCLFAAVACRGGRTSR